MEKSVDAKRIVKKRKISSFVYYHIFKALIARSLFGLHGFVTIWKVVETLNIFTLWFLAISLVGLLLETILCVCLRRGQEIAGFCLSMFFYLCAVVPSIWLLELHSAHQRTQTSFRFINTNKNNPDNNTTKDYNNISDLRDNNILTSQTNTLTQLIGVDVFRYIEEHTPVFMDEAMWTHVLEQILLVVIILARWLLPKGKMSRDQLSQLLLVHIGISADIIEFLDMFNDETVKYHLKLCKIILALWSWSLVQFLFVTPFSAGRKPRFVWLPLWNHNSRSYLTDMSYINIHVMSLLFTLFMQDGPFLAMRLVLILRFGAVNYMMIFFTCKNALITALQLYRLWVVLYENYRGRKKLKLINIKRTSILPVTRRSV